MAAEVGDPGPESPWAVATKIADELRRTTGRDILLVRPPVEQPAGKDTVDIVGRDRGPWGDADRVAEEAFGWWQQSTQMAFWGQQGLEQRREFAQPRDVPPVVLIYWEHQAATLADRARRLGLPAYNDLDRLRDRMAELADPRPGPRTAYVLSVRNRREMEDACRDPAVRVLVIGGQPVLEAAVPSVAREPTHVDLPRGIPRVYPADPATLGPNAGRWRQGRRAPGREQPRPGRDSMDR